MPTKKLTEKQAWRKIARRIEAGTWCKAGLCREVIALYTHDEISFNTSDQMHHRIGLYLGDNTWAYRMGEEHEARTLAALWMALEAEEEN